MKRDMDLIRRILLAVEEKDDGSGAWVKLQGLHKEESVLVAHLLLLAEAGYIQGTETGGMSRQGYEVRSLTWAGHDFLDAIRDEKIWNQTKAKISEISGAATVEIIKQVAVSITKSALGLST